ncbi:hypothetical protein BLA23254_05081 [Burkholderia lata]|uniref:Uncharacterized protein n=1 Tax=Burkholderia lata (strain ATCC 17760 / DSM 23089 / LMG 22485 / NCIMB 9086 / R18194 / 383) TaxID=482957 RepID=A0A6P2PKE2_BURL3|nr:hypothetical protein BLA23254_05081 [Burkholderia lata]
MMIFDPLFATRKSFENVKHCNVKYMARYYGCSL